MDLNKIGIMDMLQNKMKYHAAKQEVISQNIANVDIPGYKRKDITEPSFKGMVKSSMLNLNVTDPKHISGVNSSPFFTSHDTSDTVELDMEAIEMMKNNQDFASASTTYKKMVSLMRTAVGNQ